MILKHNDIMPALIWNNFLKGSPLLLLLLIASISKAGEPVKAPNLRSWGTYLSQVKFSSSWGLSFELHERSNSFISEHGQFLFRPSLDYHLNNKLIFSVGYTYIHTEPLNQSKSFNENNLWEQLLVINQLKSLQLQNRFRLEQRWIQRFSERSIINYSNRLRYRLNAKINVINWGNKSVFFQAFDELWFVIGNEIESFDFSRNWIYTGLGIDFSKTSNVHIGYLNQLDKTSYQSIYTHVVQLTYQLNFSAVTGSKKE